MKNLDYKLSLVYTIFKGVMMNTSFEGKTITGKDEWLTPPDLVNLLQPIDLDPCSPINRPWDTAKKHYTIIDDGLKQPWKNFVFCNPPYGRAGDPFIRKMIKHNNGILLLFGRTDTKIWHELIFQHASGILFIKGRLTFFHNSGIKGANSAGAASVLVAFGNEANNRLKSLKLGKYIKLEE